MATREASLRLRWDQSSFSSQVRQSAEGMRRAFGSAGQEISSSLKRSFGAGFDAAKRSIGSLGGTLKSALGTAATLGGAVSMGKFAKDALDAQEQAGLVAQQLRRMGQEGAEAPQVIKEARDAAQTYQRTLQDVLAGYHQVLKATGDPVFSRGSLEAVAKFGQVFRLSGEDAGTIVSLLQRKLGATTDQILNEYGPALLDQTNKGGLAIENLVTMGDKLLALLPAIGENGSRGFRTVVGILNATDSAGSTVEERFAGLKAVLVRLKDEKGFVPALKKEMHGLPKDFKNIESASDRLRAILGKKGGLEALQKLLGASPETAAIFKAVVQPFEQAKVEAMQRGEKGAAALRSGVLAFDEAMQKATRVTADRATFEAEASRRVAEPQEKLKQAVSRMAETFTDERILGAMDRLAAKLPALAEGFAKLVDFVVEHPVLAGAAVVGGRGAAAAALPMAGSLLKDWLLPGARAAGSVQEGAAKAAGETAKRAAEVAGESWRGSARAAGLTFSTAVGVASAAVAGWQIGKQIYDDVVEPAMASDIGGEGASRTLQVQQTAERALRSGSAEEQQKALAEVRKERKTIREGSAWTDVFGTAAATFTGAKAPQELRAARESELLDVEAQLAARIKSRIRLEEQAAKAAEASARAHEQLTTATRGPRRPPPPLPGSARPGG